MWNSVEFPWKYELHQLDRPVRLRESAASLKTARRSPDRLRSSPSAVIRGSTGERDVLRPQQLREPRPEETEQDNRIMMRQQRTCVLFRRAGFD